MIATISYWLGVYLGVGALSFCVLYTLYVILFIFKGKFEGREDEVKWYWKGLFYVVFIIGYILFLRGPIILG